MWYAAGLLNSLGTWGGVCFHCLWRVVVVIYKYRSLLSTITHTQTPSHSRFARRRARGTTHLRFRSQNQLHTMTQGPEVKGEQVSKGVSGEKECFYRGAESLPRPLTRECRDSPQVANVKRAFHSQSTYFPLLFFFNCVLNKKCRWKCVRVLRHIQYEEKTKQVRFVRSFSSRLGGQMRAVNTLGDVYGWVNGEAGEKPEVSSLHESERLGGFPPHSASGTLVLRTSPYSAVAHGHTIELEFITP